MLMGLKGTLLAVCKYSSHLCVPLIYPLNKSSTLCTSQTCTPLKSIFATLFSKSFHESTLINILLSFSQSLFGSFGMADALDSILGINAAGF